MISFKEFCGSKNTTFAIWNHNNFGACFENLALILPANLLLGVSSAIFCLSKSGMNLRGFPIPVSTRIKLLISMLISLEILVEVVTSAFLVTSLPPVYLFISIIMNLAWGLNTGALWKMRYLCLIKLCLPAIQVLFTLAVTVTSALQFYAVILQVKVNGFSDKYRGLQEYGTVIRFSLQVLYIVLQVPCGSEQLSENDDDIFQPSVSSSSIQASLSGERRPLLRSVSSHGTFYSGSGIGIAEDKSNFLSRLVFWWVKPLMIKGYKGEIQQPEDLFLLPQSLSTTKIKWIFYRALYSIDPHTESDSETNESSGFRADSLQHDVRFIQRVSPIAKSLKSDFYSSKKQPDRKQRTLLSALNHAFGLQYYSIGLLKLFGDCLGFAGPLLLHALVSYMENSNEPIQHGYYYAVGLFLSTLFAALASSQFNYWVSKVGIKIRAAVITTVYQKALSVSSTSLVKFSTGEVINFMSTDTDRVVNFCPSFHQFWSLPFQIAVSLYLLHQQVGLAFLAGLGFVLLLVPVNRYLAIKIQQLSKEMMAQKDGRVKVMNEILCGIRVIKFYTWERNFKDSITQLRAAELKSLKGRKYLDAWCVFFWATTPVLISILTFTTYVLLGNKLTAAKVFTSVALFNMLISPLNAFPWVLNGLMEAWVSLQRIQAFLSLKDLDLAGYYVEASSSTLGAVSEGSGAAITITDGKFSWVATDGDEPEEGQTTSIFRGLSRVQISIERFLLLTVVLDGIMGQLIGVVGKVGAGKSSLLSAVTAELQKLGGEVYVANLDKGFGLVAQEPWIQHATVKENILFGKPYDVDEYWAVIRACALEEDLQILPAGDETEVGENGVTLSGGQKARVALARAVYQDKDIYLLDDPLAAVDTHVAVHLFQHCIMGLLKHKTRILCTHHTKFLNTADQVIVMECGSIVYSGTPEKILGSERMVRQYSGVSDEEDSAKSDDETEDLREEEKTAQKQQQDGSLVKEEEREVGVVKLHVYKSYWLAVGHCLATSILLALLLMQASRNLSDWWLAYWISHSHSPSHRTPSVNVTAFAPGPTTHYNHLYKVDSLMNGGGPTDAAVGVWHVAKNSIAFYLIVYGSLALANTIFTLFRSFLYAYGGICAAKVIHNQLLDSILAAPISFFDITPIGRIINRFSSDIYAIDDSLPFIMNILLAQAFGVAGTVVITCYGLPWLVLMLIPLAIIYYFIQNYYRRTSRELKRLMTVTLSPIYAHFSETLTGLNTIRALRETDRFNAENEERLETNQQASFCAMVAAQWLGLRLQFLGVAMVTAVAFIAVLEHHFSTVDPGLVGLAISYALSVTDRLSSMVNAFAETEKQMVSVERAVQYIEDVPSEAGGHGSAPAIWPSAGCVTFKNVILVYRPGLPPALNRVTLSTNPGEKIGIVGRTGSGKSSLLLVLFRMVGIQDGLVLIDGLNTASLPLAVLRSRLAIIPQDAFLFSGSVRQNLDPWRRYTDVDIWIAIERCHLKRAVEELGGLEANVGERGRNFSVGQRQLICLARALLTKAKIICIDEATASVDLETDRLIQETIRGEFGDSTVLTIAHRQTFAGVIVINRLFGFKDPLRRLQPIKLVSQTFRIETIMDSDRVLVMDKGTVAEFAAPDQLVSDRDSIFYGLVHSN